MWVRDSTGGGAISISDTQAIHCTMGQSVRGYSCDAPQGLTLSEFDMQDNFVDNARRRNLKVIVGDFNEWALEWGNKENNAKVRSLLEAVAQLNIVLVIEINVSSFWNRNSASIEH